MKSRINGLLAWLMLLLTTGGIIWILIAPTLAEIAQQEQDYVRKLALLARLEALPKEEQAIRQTLDSLSNDAASRLLYAGDHNSVQSQLQLDIRQLAARSNINVNSVRSLPAFRQSGMVQGASVQLNLDLTQEGLIQFLKEIEQAEPILRVKRLTVRVRQESTESSAAQLSVALEMTGFRQEITTGAEIR